MTKQKLIDAEEEKRRLEEESAQVRGTAPLLGPSIAQTLDSWQFSWELPVDTGEPRDSRLRFLSRSLF